MASMFLGSRPLFLSALAVTLAAAPAHARDGGALQDFKLPGMTDYRGPHDRAAPHSEKDGEITLSAQLIDKGPDITRGLVWRVFKPKPGPDGKLPMVASAHGGTSVFRRAPGS